MTEAKCSSHNAGNVSVARELLEPEVKKSYAPPLLEQLGDVRGLTLAPSPGIFESGGPGGGAGYRSPLPPTPTPGG